MKLLIDLQGAQTESRHRGIGRQARALAASLIEVAGAHESGILLNSGLNDGLDELYREFSAILPASHIDIFGVPGQVRENQPANLWRTRASELHREALIADLKPDVLYVSSLFEGVGDDAVTSIGLMQAPYATAATLFDLIPLYDREAYLGAEFMRNFYYRRAQSLKRADRLVAIPNPRRTKPSTCFSFRPTGSTSHCSRPILPSAGRSFPRRRSATCVIGMACRNPSYSMSARSSRERIFR